MKAATAMKEALDAVRDPGCAYEGPGVCRCCETRVQPANDCLAGLDNATVARMDWVAELEHQDLARIVKALELAEEATDRFGRREEGAVLRRLRGELEKLT